jgi:hypothetical protein
MPPLEISPEPGEHGVPDGEGNMVDALRLAVSGDTLYFLWTVNGPINRRFSYRLYFIFDDEELPILMVSTHPFRDGDEVVARNFRTEAYRDVNGARLSYRVNGNMIEGRVIFPAGYIERVVGLDHAKIKYDAPGDGHAIRYRAGRFRAVGNAVSVPGATRIDAPHTYQRVDFSALMDWVSAVR